MQGINLSLITVWEVCSMIGEGVARTTALLHADFFGLCPCPLLHHLRGCKGRGGEGKTLCKLMKLDYYLAMTETFNWKGWVKEVFT